MINTMQAKLHFHHIGVATSDLEKAIAVYKKLGYALQDEKTFLDPIQQVHIGFMICEGHPMIELIAPANENSPVQKIISKMGASPYHTCYEVSDIEESIRMFKAEKFIVVVKPVPAVAFNNRTICFLFNSQIGLVELLQG